MSAPPLSGPLPRSPLHSRCTGATRRAHQPHGIQAISATLSRYVACITGVAFALCEGRGRYPRLAPLRGPFTIFSIRGIT
ncbi:hypothetical protein GCT13_24130 [Paraburkholderia sp. CNPSo 3157]|uniref:Uncharacterized protein n=1 Tax=Paraburkholderia franconis TaxID=2654983 RepID=A0A7X1THY7_9BURK|nr:hypothetical protein [Paraburkholderia franconis]